DGLGTALALDTALEYLDTALDGYQPDQVGNRPAPFPAGAFARVPDPLPDLAGVPALAVTGAVEDNLLGLVADQVDRLASAVGEPAPVTHLGYGLRIGLPLPAPADGDPEVTATLRFDLGSAKLVRDALPALQPVTRLLFTATIGDGSSWLLGGP